VSETGVPTATVEMPPALELAPSGVGLPATGLDSSTPRTVGSEPSTAAVAPATAAVDWASTTGIGMHGNGWTVERARAAEEFLFEVRSRMASLAAHLQLDSIDPGDSTRREHPAIVTRRPRHAAPEPSPDEPHAELTETPPTQLHSVADSSSEDEATPVEATAMPVEAKAMPVEVDPVDLAYAEPVDLAYAEPARPAPTQLVVLPPVQLLTAPPPTGAPPPRANGARPTQLPISPNDTAQYPIPALQPVAVVDAPHWPHAGNPIGAPPPAVSPVTANSTSRRRRRGWRRARSRA
jgi:hypothetical protein